MALEKKLIIALVLLCSACTDYPKKIEDVLEAAGDNRAELEKVMNHYSVLGDEEKLKAAWFLIGNMGNKFSFSGESVQNFDVIFGFLDSLHRHKIKVPVASPVLRKKWDELLELHGYPSTDQAETDFDYDHITATYLIENIDAAFEIRKTSPWCRELSFEQFCEYILPYRIANERLEPWRKYLYQEYKTVLDTGKFNSPLAVGEMFNKYMRKHYALNHIMREYPFDMTPRQMEQARRGACKHLVQYEATALRAMGIPAGIDFAPLWGDLDRGHEWNTLLIGNDSIFPFDAAQEKFGGFDQYPYRFAKVFRQVFASGEREISGNDVPPHLAFNQCIDVTHEYSRTFDIAVPLTIPFANEKKIAVICTYGNRDWFAQDWGRVRNRTAEFRNMGSNLVYIVMYFHNRKYYPATDPFILEKNGSIRYLRPEETEFQSITPLRKYPSFPRNNSYLESMIGIAFQGANRADFSDAVNLYTIDRAPSKFEEKIIANPGKFRYVRCVSQMGGKLNVAELEFYGKMEQGTDDTRLTGKIIGFPEVSPELGTPYQNAFDENLETYFAATTPTYSWAGLDLGKQVRITKISYCPRSDTNFIVKGNTYDLHFWKNDQWVSLGKQKATSQVLRYDSAPRNALFLLHNLSHGKEERVFTYENGMQVWW